MEGYHMKDENGKLSGYGIEFLNRVSEYSNLNFICTGYDKSWEDMLAMLEDGEIDVVTSASKTTDREKLFSYSLPMGRKQTVLSIRVEDTTHLRGNYDTYEGIKVGMLEGNTANSRLYEFAKNNGFTYVRRQKTADTLRRRKMAVSMRNH